MKNLLSLSTVVFFLFAFTTTGLAQQKIAHVDSDLILTQMPEYKQAKANVETLSNVLSKDLETKRTEIQKYYQSIVEQQETLPPVKIKEAEEKLKKMELDLQKAAQEADGKLAQKEQELTKPIYEKFSATLEKVAEANGFAYIFDLKMALYNKGGINATDLVKAELGL